MPDDHRSKTFTWTSPDDVQITIPSMGSVKTGIIRRYRKSEGIDGMFSMLEAIVDDDTLAKLDDLEAADFNAFCEAWQEDAQAKVGESSGSST